MAGFGRKGRGPHNTVELDRRASRRSAVARSGKIDTPIARLPVILVDVSATGAQVIGANLPEIGAFVHLKIGNCTAFATVVRRDGEDCGLKFDEPLGERSIASFRTAAHEAEALGLNPEEQLARQFWLERQFA